MGGNFFLALVFILSISFSRPLMASRGRCSDTFKKNSSLKTVLNLPSKVDYPSSDPVMVSRHQIDSLLKISSKEEGAFETMIFNKTIVVPNWISMKFSNKITEVKVNLVFWNKGEVQQPLTPLSFTGDHSVLLVRLLNPHQTKLSIASEQKLDQTSENLLHDTLDIPLTNRNFIESLLPRSRFYKLFYQASEKFDGETIISRGRPIPPWHVDKFFGNELTLDVSNFSKAELWVLINEIAAYLNNPPH